jgi:MurNAc alpha-1-phosphate uridylyltransferase
MAHPITTAMVLAAGYGTRMRPLTDTIPKPLVRLAGRPLLDHVLDRIAASGIRDVVVNVHYLADQIEAHVAARRDGPTTRISDERAALLDTGGGVVKALPWLGAAPFLIHNSDSVWIEDTPSALGDLAAAFDDATCDALLLLAETARAVGYHGRGDFARLPDGRIRRPAAGETVPYVYTGVQIASPRLFADAPAGAFSANRLWDRAIAAGRARGVVLRGLWMHVGSPQELADAERVLSGPSAHRGATAGGADAS